MWMKLFLFPVILLEMDESVCLLVFLLHVPPRQSKIPEAGEGILAWLTGLSPSNSVIVGLFTLLITANKILHNIIYPEISFSSKIMMTCYPCFQTDKFCSHKEVDLTDDHTKP